MTIQSARDEATTAFRDAQLPRVIGGAIPAILWEPLMAELSGHTLNAIELPGHGLTDRARHHHTTFRRTAGASLADLSDALDIGLGRS